MTKAAELVFQAEIDHGHAKTQKRFQNPSHRAVAKMDPPAPRPVNHLLNVILVGLGFMLIFGAFQTCCMVEETVINSARKQDPNFNGNG